MNRWFYQVILTCFLVIFLNHQNVVSAQNFPTTSAVLPPTPFSIPPNGIQCFPSQVSLQEPLEYSVQVQSGIINNIYVSFCQRDVLNGIYGSLITNSLINGKIALSPTQLQDIYRQTLCISLIGRTNNGIERATLFDLTTTILAGASGVDGSISATQGAIAPQTTTTPIPITTAVIPKTPFFIQPNAVQNFPSQVSLEEPLQLSVQVDSGSISNIFISFCQRDVQNGIYGYNITNSLTYGAIALLPAQLQAIYRATFCISLTDRAAGSIQSAALNDFITTIQAGAFGVIGSLSASQGAIAPQTTTTVLPITSPVMPNTPFSIPANSIKSFSSQVILLEPLEISVQIGTGTINNIFASFCPSDVQKGIFGISIINAFLNGQIALSASDLQAFYGQTACRSQMDRANGGINNAALNDLITTILAGATGVDGSLSASQIVIFPPDMTTTVAFSTTSSALNQPFSTAPYGVNSFTCEISLTQPVDFSVKVTEGMIGRMYASFCLREVHDGNYGVAIQNMIISTNFGIQPSRMVEIYRKTFCPSQSRRADGSVDKFELYQLSVTIIGGPIGTSGEIAIGQP